MIKLLWVEDENAIFLSHRKNLLLLKPEIHVDSVSYGEQAVDLLSRNFYNLIVIDLRINWKPGLINNDFFGINLIELMIKGSTTVYGEEISIQQRTNATSIWVLTGYADRLKDALGLGIQPLQYIVKGTERKTDFLNRLVESISNA